MTPCCAESSRLLVVVEPPLSVVNALLDRCRHFAADLAGGTPDWIPPHFWSAPLVDLGPDSEETRVFAQDVLRAAFRDTPELAVQLSPLNLGPGPVPGEALLVAHVLSREEALSGLAATACAAADAIGLPARAEAVFQIPLAVIRGEEAIRAVSSLVAVPGEAHPIRWNLGGVCLATAARDRSGSFRPRRLRFLPLKRGTTPRKEGGEPAASGGGTDVAPSGRPNVVFEGSEEH